MGRRERPLNQQPSLLLPESAPPASTKAKGKTVAASPDHKLRSINKKQYGALKKYKFKGGFTSKNAVGKLFVFPASFFHEAVGCDPSADDSSIW